LNLGVGEYQKIRRHFYVVEYY